ncbi:hypothetical protein [Teredinibacter purpureus]|uniref:hypothetical protein n=1 Tax=Teredinibacter purpureus TaxID=2731756 RepID=UPI0005F7E380|nr:hypothetical protein [Teredinibacter purpureus]
MNVRELVSTWHKHAHCTLTDNTYDVTLSLEDAAKVDALAEMYPRRSKEQLISELVTSALAELEASFPYIAGPKVVAMDEFGEPLHEDIGPTPEFLTLTKEHLARHKATKTK